ncbi:MAG: Hpt domain-containing protein, partial [Bacteroidota bacterium]
MSNSYENFQSKFIDEALDNIADLEKALMALELSPNDKELVERIFRAMHSLKGGGAMFGFDRLSEFTHRMENIYEMVRNGNLCASTSLLSVTFQSVDLLREMLEEPGEMSPQLKNRYQEMEKTIDKVVKEETERILKSAKGGCKEGLGGYMEETEGGTYFIHFYPGSEVLKNGINLFYLLDDLRQIGQLYAIPGVNAVPSFDEMDPSKSYLFWDMFLSTNKGENAIRDVFIFVEDDATLEVHRLSGADLFKNDEFNSRVNELADRQKKFEISEITRLAQKYAPYVAEEEADSMVQIEPETEDSNDKEPEYQDNKYSENFISGNGSGGRKVNTSIRVSTEKIDGLMNLVSEMVITQERLNMIAGQYHIPELKLVSETVQKLTAQLR